MKRYKKDVLINTHKVKTASVSFLHWPDLSGQQGLLHLHRPLTAVSGSPAVPLSQRDVPQQAVQRARPAGCRSVPAAPTFLQGGQGTHRPKLPFWTPQMVCECLPPVGLRCLFRLIFGGETVNVVKLCVSCEHRDWTHL